MKLLERYEFRQQVFARDHYVCVICGTVAQDAHHIMERRLFDDGDFRRNVAKYVREDHIQDTVHNWKHQPIIQNKNWKDNGTIRLQNDSKSKKK